MTDSHGLTDENGLPDDAGLTDDVWVAQVLAADPVTPMPEDVFRSIDAALRTEQQHRAARDEFAPRALPAELDRSLGDEDQAGEVAAPAHFERPGMGIAETIW